MRIHTSWMPETTREWSAMGKELDAQEHVRPGCQQQHRDSQPLAKRWMHENTYVLNVGNNTGQSVSLGKQLEAREHVHPGCQKQHRTVSPGKQLDRREHARPECRKQHRDSQPLAKSRMDKNTHILNVGNDTGRLVLAKN